MLRITTSEYLEPEFFEISDWRKPKETAKPKWFSIWNINGKSVCHPSVLEEIGSIIPERCRA